METSKEEQLWQAATAGNLDCVRELAEDPGVDVNWADKEMKRTPLYRASGHNWPAIVEYLLRNPRTLVNQQMAEGASPFFIACQGGWKDIVILLLADPRVDVELPDDHNSSPLWHELTLAGDVNRGLLLLLYCLLSFSSSPLLLLLLLISSSF